MSTTLDEHLAGTLAWVLLCEQCDKEFERTEKFLRQWGTPRYCTTCVNSKKNEALMRRKLALTVGKK